MKKILILVLAVFATIQLHAVQLAYGPGVAQKADFVSGTTQTVNGYVVSGTLSSFNQVLYYAINKQVQITGGSPVQFANYYLKQGITISSSTQDLKQLLYYSAGDSLYVKPASQVNFGGGFLVRAQPAYDQTIRYNDSYSAYMSSGAFVTFVNNRLASGYLSNLMASHDLNYALGFSRVARIKGNSFVEFGGANTVGGVPYLKRGMTHAYAQTLNTSAFNSVSVPAYTTVNFANGFYTP